MRAKHARGLRTRAVTLILAAVAAVSSSGLASADVPVSSKPAHEATENTPLGVMSPLAAGPITRSAVMARAKLWVDAGIPYSNDPPYQDGYRRDCSGFVSYAWAADMSYTTDSLDDISYRIAKDDLLPGDVLLWQNPNWPQEFGHVRIFGGWLDPARSRYWVYEQTPPRAVYNEYSWSSTFPTYLPYRYHNIRDELSGVSSDVTGDGRVDVLARDGAGELWIYPHDGRTGTGNPYLTRYSAGTGWNLATALTIGDVTGDTRPDILARDSAGELWIYPHDGRIGTGNPYLSRYSAGTGWNLATALT